MPGQAVASSPHLHHTLNFPVAPQPYTQQQLVSDIESECFHSSVLPVVGPCMLFLNDGCVVNERAAQFLFSFVKPSLVSEKERNFSIATKRFHNVSNLQTILIVLYGIFQHVVYLFA